MSNTSTAKSRRFQRPAADTASSVTGSPFIGKIVDYLRVGVPLAVLIDAPSQSASVFGSSFDQRIFAVADTLTLPEVLPGFSLPVASLFA
jgi:Uma2 family endonuclease